MKKNAIEWFSSAFRSHLRPEYVKHVNVLTLLEAILVDSKFKQVILAHYVSSSSWQYFVSCSEVVESLGNAYSLCCSYMHCYTYSSFPFQPSLAFQQGQSMAGDSTILIGAWILWETFLWKLSLKVEKYQNLGISGQYHKVTHQISHIMLMLL